MMAGSSPTTNLPPRGGYDPVWFDVLSEVEDRHFWFRARNRIIAAALRPLVTEIGPHVRLLEVGCGTGKVLKVLEELCPKGQLVGLDPFQEALGHARRRCDAVLVPGDIRHAPFADGSFDLIGMFDVLEHLPDDRQVLRVLHSLLAPGGSVVMTVPACPSLWSYFDELSGHCRRYQTADLIAKLVQAGFRVTYATHFMMTIFPLVWAGRRWAGNRHRRSGESSPSRFGPALTELKVRPVLNQFLLRLLDWEPWWIARRRCLPIGTSLLAVARKVSADRTVDGGLPSGLKSRGV